MRYFCVIDDDGPPYVVIESASLYEAQGTYVEPHVHTREEMLALYPEALARWEAGDDSAYLAAMVIDMAEAVLQEAEERARGLHRGAK